MAMKATPFTRMFPKSPKIKDGDKEPTINEYMPMNVKNKNEGAFGKVYQVREKKTDAIYAMKIISKAKVREYQMVEEIRREIRILYQLSHPNIIKMNNHFEDKSNVYLVMEHSLNPPLIHRDIKPENILMAGDQIKLIDFGWSNFIVDNKKRETLAGTPAYLPPEMIDGIPHDQRLDLWNVGVLTFELLAGYPPFSSPGQTERELHKNIVNIAVKYPSDFPAEAKDFVMKLLKRNPAQRLPLSEIKAHPWLVKFFPNRESFHQKLPSNRQLLPANIGDDDPIVVVDENVGEESKSDDVDGPLAKLKAAVEEVLSSSGSKRDQTLKLFKEWLQLASPNATSATGMYEQEIAELKKKLAATSLSSTEINSNDSTEVSKLKQDNKFLENSKAELEKQVWLQKQQIETYIKRLDAKDQELKDA
eukprot:CAMPEP_0115045644 /NCGR_PEP_ID=MMETSP0216-20121206/48265_1 /TAXON_ID=223996 /ORGANISM="Protocruzia adherens, Strain Boccale" /LENGTH=418 /DNA_ID=CAMNT_0002428551 /DNA_START=34 /DNA_END=1286 /DNA_ORIENTATION=+